MSERPTGDDEQEFSWARVAGSVEDRLDVFARAVVEYFDGHSRSVSAVTLVRTVLGLAFASGRDTRSHNARDAGTQTDA